MTCTQLPERIKIKFKKSDLGGVYITAIENAMYLDDIKSTYGADIEKAFVNSGAFYELTDSPKMGNKVKVLIVTFIDTKRSIYSDNLYHKASVEEFVKILKEADTNLRRLIIEKAKRQREEKLRKKVYVITI